MQGAVVTSVVPINSLPVFIENEDAKRDSLFL